MRKTVTFAAVVVALLLLVCCSTITAFAADESAIDYDALFARAVDYSELFDRANTMDGGPAEVYFFEVNQIFDQDPESFVAAFSNESYKTINMLSYYLAIEHGKELTAYTAVLDRLTEHFSSTSDIQDTLFLMRMGILVYESGPKKNDPDYFVRTHHQSVQQFFKDDNRLFLLSFSYNNSPAICDDFAVALMHGLTNDELEALDAQLSSLTTADWAADYVKSTISVIRDRIDETLNPPPPVTEPDVTEPTAPSTPATEPTVTIPSNAPQTSEPNNDWVIPCISICAVLTAVIVVILVRKKK